MTNEILISMPKKDILFGAKHTFKNAKNLFESADQLAVSGNFGTGNSLLILSIEESIKAMLLIAGFFNTKIDFDIEPFFWDHKTKHKEAAKMQDFISKFSFFKDILITAINKRDSLTDFLMQLGLSSLFSAINFGTNDPNKFQTWYANANNQKNNGLYVGYRNSIWSLPSSTTRDMFEETKSIARPFIDSIELIVHLKDEDYKLLEDLNNSESDVSKAQKPFKLLSSDDYNQAGNLDLENYKKV